jgi:hypothetical protein
MATCGGGENGVGVFFLQDQGRMHEDLLERRREQAVFLQVAVDHQGTVAGDLLVVNVELEGLW